MQTSHLAATLFAFALLPAGALAQDNTPEPLRPHCKLVYRLLQVGADGKVSVTHDYSTIVLADDPRSGTSKIRSGDKVPIVTSAGASTGPRDIQYQYQDVGTNIDTSQSRLHDRQLSLHLSAAVSAVAKNATGDLSGTPIFRSISWESDVVVPLDKPVIIFTSDNVSDAGKTELELTATQIKEP